MIIVIEARCMKHEGRHPVELQDMRRVRDGPEPSSPFFYWWWWEGGGVGVGDDIYNRIQEIA